VNETKEGEKFHDEIKRRNISGIVTPQEPPENNFALCFIWA
jgi:hypothetical protein